MTSWLDGQRRSTGAHRVPRGRYAPPNEEAHTPVAPPDRPDMQAQLRSFVVRFLDAWKAPYRLHPEGILEVECDPSLVALLYGPRRPVQNALFAFDTRSLQLAPEVELLAPGSPSLHKIMDAVESRGRICPMTLDCDPPVSTDTLYRPHLAVGIRITYSGGNRAERLAEGVVDMATGTVFPGSLPAAPPQARWVSAAPPPNRQERRRIGYRDAYRRLLAHLVDALRREEHTWAARELERLTQEKQRLDSYYAELASDDSVDPENLDIREERGRRLGELDRARPKVILRPYRTAVAYIPLEHPPVLIPQPFV